MDQATTKWGSGLKANQGNVSATEPSRTLEESRPQLVYSASVFLIPAVQRSIITAVTDVITIVIFSGERRTLVTDSSAGSDFELGHLLVNVIKGDFLDDRHRTWSVRHDVHADLSFSLVLL